jgi:prophage regulatory protein
MDITSANTSPLDALQAHTRMLPLEGFIRQSALIPNLVPFSAATLWRKVKSKEFPAPVKLSARVTAWRVQDIRDWLERHN